MTDRRDEPSTSEMRHDWLADRWVIIAPQRTERPHDFIRKQIDIGDQSTCPFCIGHEAQTPAAVASYIASKNLQEGADSESRNHNHVPQWHVRVVPNKFPAVSMVESAVGQGFAEIQAGLESAESVIASAAVRFDTRTSTAEQVNLFRRHDLQGGHEVIVESPNHIQSISQLDAESTGLVFRAYRDRLRFWLTEKKISYGVVFKNVGIDAGASLYHSHSQLIATNIIPTAVERSVRRMRRFYEKEHECLMCRMKNDEMEQGSRIVEETRNFIAFCPFASRLPSLITVIPKEHHSQFELMGGVQTEEVGRLIQRLVRRVEACFPSASYNFIIHTAPSLEQGTEAFHWRIELFPRLTTIAGFEWGSDCYINPIAPEAAAARLRDVAI